MWGIHMKKTKLVTLATTVLLSSGLLAACSPDKPKEDSSTPASSTVASEKTEDSKDAVASASVTANPEDLVKSLSADGTWIAAATADITLDKDLVVDGEFHDKDDSAQPIYRKLALHTQDDKYNILDQFTLTVPKIVVNSENFTVFYGTIKGDIEVNANGFSLIGTQVDGNITFTKEEYKESANLDKDDKGAKVTGEVTVAE